MPVKEESLKGLSITTLVDGYVDMFAPSGGPLTRVKPGQIKMPLIGGHGSSFLVDCHYDSRSFSLLIDGGLVPAMIKNNLISLGREAAEVEALVLTHGHPDHYKGLESVSREVRAGTPLYAHPDAFLTREIRTPRGVAGPWALDREKLSASGLKIIDVLDWLNMAPGVGLSGEIPEEAVPLADMPGHFTFHGEESHPETGRDEIVIVFDRGQRGLVVLSACAHRWAPAVVRFVADLKRKKVAGLIAGFHLSQAPQEKIRSLATELAEMDLDFVLSGHCTGFRANAVLSQALGDRFFVNTVGSRLEW